MLQLAINKKSWTEKLLECSMNLSSAVEKYQNSQIKLSDLEHEYLIIKNILEQDNKQENFFSREIIHDLKNHYNVISSYITLKKENYSTPEFEQRIKSIHNALENTSLSLLEEKIQDQEKLFHFNNSIVFSNNPFSNYISSTKIYSQIEDISSLLNNRIQIKITKDETQDYKIKQTSSSHLYRIMYNIANNKQRYSDSKIINMFIEPILLKNHIQFNIYDDSNIPISDKFQNPEDICKKNVSGHNSTGIGLTAVKKLATQSLDGYFNVIRQNQDYNKEKYNGAKFELGISLDNYLTKATFFDLRNVNF